MKCPMSKIAKIGKNDKRAKEWRMKKDDHLDREMKSRHTRSTIFDRICPYLGLMCGSSVSHVQALNIDG